MPPSEAFVSITQGNMCNSFNSDEFPVHTRGTLPITIMLNIFLPTVHVIMKPTFKAHRKLKFQ